MPDAIGYRATDGAGYERFLGRWTRRLAPLFLDFAAVPGGLVLDIGCGTGSLAGATNGRAVGVDLSPEYLRAARAEHGLRVAAARADRLPFADAGFAGALSQLVLNFVPDTLAAAREARRVLAAGGVGAACVWDFCGGLVYQRILWDTAAGFDARAAKARDALFAHPLAAPGGLEALWRAAGFREVRAASLTIRMDFADFADYWEPLLAGQGPFGGFVAGLAPADRERLREAVRAAFLAGRPDGLRSLAATAWAVRGLA